MSYSRGDILDAAKNCVTGKREQDYGKAEDNFGLISKLWSDYLGYTVEVADVPMMMILLKAARVKSGGGSGDSYVDIAGYAACAGEICAGAHQEDRRRGWEQREEVQGAEKTLEILFDGIVREIRSYQKGLHPASSHDDLVRSNASEDAIDIIEALKYLAIVPDDLIPNQTTTHYND